MDFANEFLVSCIKRFKEYKGLGEKTFAQLSDEAFHFQPNKASNSIAVIIQHLNGNMVSRWSNFLTEDGEKPWRSRDNEFETQSLSKEQLMQLWNEGWDVCLASLELLTAEDLVRTITIRTQPLIVVDAINRQLAHYGYHVGQIVYLGRWIKNKDWQSLSIAKGGSVAYNEKLKK